jgi:FkbM family methyltransferase
MTLRDAIWRAIEAAPAAIAYPALRWRSYRYDPEVFDTFRALCDPRRATVDVGAHNGVYASFFAQHSARVYAFEPNPNNFRRLARLESQRIECFRVALADANGDGVLGVPTVHGRELSEGGSLGATTGAAYATPVRTLDSYVLEDVGFIKIDVEGSERAVLRGAAATIARSRPIIAVEIVASMVGEDGLRATVAEVQAMRYACSFMWRGTELAYDRFDLATHQLGPQAAGDLRRAVKDFIFRPQRA